MLQQDILCRNGRVDFELEYPMAVGLLTIEKRLARKLDGSLELPGLGVRLGSDGATLYLNGVPLDL